MAFASMANIAFLGAFFVEYTHRHQEITEEVKNGIIVLIFLGGKFRN